MLFWRTRNQLTHEKNLGPFALPERDPEYPIDYVLDGQQRITSIFGVFQTELAKSVESEWLDVYFDHTASEDVQDSQFFALSDSEVEADKHFPMSTLFDVTAFRRGTEELGEDTIRQLDDLQSVFKEIQIPIQLLNTEDRTRVAIVFERINRLGVELDTLQLLTAWTWSEDFDLQQRFLDLRESLSEYGFSEVGEDTNLVLRCCAAALKEDPSADSLISLNGAEVREQFSRVENGIRGAVDFLRGQLRVQSLQNVPYPALLVPLSVFFAEPEGKEVHYSAETHAILKRWFWRACFSRRYSGQTVRAARTDIAEMVKLKNGEASSLGDFSHEIDDNFFIANQFRTRLQPPRHSSFCSPSSSLAPSSRARRSTWLPSSSSTTAQSFITCSREHS